MKEQEELKNELKAGPRTTKTTIAPPSITMSGTAGLDNLCGHTQKSICRETEMTTTDLKIIRIKVLGKAHPLVVCKKSYFLFLKSYS